MQKILHTPEGVRDIYSRECEQKLLLQQNLLASIHSYGYRDIETPTFEFFDVFGKEVGTIPMRELFKFFDRDGNTLVLRPDFTPSVARAAAKYLLTDHSVVRLTYLGNTFVNNSSYQGRLKESTQIGAELIGEDSADADAEVISLTVQAMKKAGLKEFQVSIGHAGFFRALATEACLDEDLVEQLKDLVSNKNTFGMEKLLSGYEMAEEQRYAFSLLPTLFGGADVLAKARTLTGNKKALAAIDRLWKIYEILKIYGVDPYVSFDLGMLSRYNYYTGIVFRGYTYGTGDAVIKGGRYDDLLGHFGKTAPAVGFVIQVDQLQSAMARQGIRQPSREEKCLILYDEAHRLDAVKMAEELRAEGICTELRLMNDGRGEQIAREEYSRIEDLRES